MGGLLSLDARAEPHRHEGAPTLMVGLPASGVVSLMEAIKLRQSMQQVGLRRLNPGMTSAVGAGLNMHVVQLPEGEQHAAGTTPLMRHVLGYRRLIIAVDSTAAAANPFLLLPTVQRIDSLLDVLEDVAAWKVLVAATTADALPTSSPELQGRLEAAFAAIGRRVGSLRCCSIATSVNVMDRIAEDLAWLASEVTR